MKKSHLVYSVIMYRFADRDSHSYIIGVYDNLQVAKEKAEDEKQHRGGNKYYPEIIEFDLNNQSHEKIILKTGQE